MSDTILQKHSRMPRKPASTQRALLRSPSRRDGRPVPLEEKQAILDDAKLLILAGKTIDQIAAKHGISHYTLDLWLHALGDEYKELRQAWVDNMLMESGELLKQADDPLALARARELQRRAQWYAERRDRQRYGEIRDFSLNVNLNGDLGDRLRRARERVIEPAEVVRVIEGGASESVGLACAQEAVEQ